MEHDEEQDYRYISEDQDELLNAVTTKNVEQLRQLLSQGIDPCFVDDDGKSPLHIVCGKTSSPGKVSSDLDLTLILLSFCVSRCF